MAERKISRHSHNFQDLTGRHFTRLIVLRLERSDGNNVYWLCRCDCGQERIVLGNNLRRGLSKSCGCYRDEIRTKHGKDKQREYKAWHAAKQRCTRPEVSAYPEYGGRGITMCDRWIDSFETFFEDMGPCPPGLSLDRIDNDGPYSPTNCRWTTQVVQQSNRRVTVMATHNGETLPLKEWARRSGEGYTTLLNRLKSGRPIFERQRKQRS